MKLAAKKAAEQVDAKKEEAKRQKLIKFNDEADKLWKIKPLTYEQMADLPFPDCGCECRECIGTFREHWIVKAKFTELRKALVREKQAMSETIEEVNEMELDYEKRLEDYRLELVVEREKNAQLSHDLDNERTLRIEDIYKADRQAKESDSVMEDMRGYRQQMKNMSMELKYLRDESEKMKNLLRRGETTKKDLVNQIKSYESQVNELERTNLELRGRAHKANILLANNTEELDSLKIQLQRTVAEKPRYNPLRNSLLGRDDMHAESYSSMKQKQQQKSNGTSKQYSLDTNTIRKLSPIGGRGNRKAKGKKKKDKNVSVLSSNSSLACIAQNAMGRGEWNPTRSINLNSSVMYGGMLENSFAT